MEYRGSLCLLLLDPRREERDIVQSRRSMFERLHYGEQLLIVRYEVQFNWLHLSTVESRCVPFWCCAGCSGWESILAIANLGGICF